MKKVLILMISGGGGHLASAKAIAHAIEHLYDDKITTSIVDVSKQCPFRPINRLDDIYQWLTDDGVWLWKALWNSDEKAWVPRVFSRILTPFFRNTMSRIYRKESPDLVVSVHGFVNHIPLRVLRRALKANIPFVTVVTDMVTAHPVWFCREVDYCMVPTEEAKQRAVRYGMPPANVEVVGQPVDLDFAANLGEKHELRARLDLHPTRPCVLVVGGGDGMGPVYENARAIATTVANGQMIVVAGRNAALKQRLESTSWEIPTRIYGFVNNMPELMSVSDLLVTKGGPGTLAEAFIAGLPVIISSYIPGQEEGNVKYVLDHKAGAYANDPSEVAEIAREWLTPGNNDWKQVVTNAAAIARPEASLVIARRLHKLLNNNSTNKPISWKQTHRGLPFSPGV